MKLKLSDFLPPIISHYFKRQPPSKVTENAPKIFSTYAEAQDACSGAGYEDGELVQTVFEKTRLIKDQMMNRELPLPDSAAQSLLAVLLSWRQGGRQKKTKVIDFGGACGAHYFQIRPFLPKDIQLDWVVVETPAMVEKAGSFETSELHFAASMREAQERLQDVDLLHSSGTLQYVPDPQMTLREFIACQPAAIFLNRLVLSASSGMIMVQESRLSANGPGPLPQGIKDRLCRYPVTYYPKQLLEDLISQSHQIKLRFADTKTLIGDREILVNTGLFAERF